MAALFYFEEYGDCWIDAEGKFQFGAPRNEDTVYVEYHHPQHGHVASCQLQDWSSPGAWLSKVFVPAEVRGQGLGRKLVEAAIAHCRDWKKEAISLSCVITNEAALHLYRSLGFKIAGYGKDTTRYLLTLTLDDYGLNQTDTRRTAP